MGCTCSKDSVRVENIKFFVLHRIAEGGFGVIDLVEDKRKNLYALKRIKCNTKEDAEKVAQENSYYKRFNNDNIIRLIYDDVVEDTIHALHHVFLVFPYYKNGTVSDEIDINVKKSIFMSEDRIVKLTIGVCNALNDIFAANLAHRDLKPQNILLSDDRNSAILTDFGSMSERIIEIPNSKKSQHLQDWAAENCSLFYKAPELFQPQENTKITEKADIWSLGCNLYTLMYNKGPFDYVLNRGDSIALAAGSARFTVPDTPKRSDKLVNILKSTITVEPEKRLSVGNVMTELLTLNSLTTVKLTITSEHC